MTVRADVLMVTYRSAGYLHLSLDALLSSLSEHDRVWLWHNGDDEATLDVLSRYRRDKRIARFHHSRANVRLQPPMRWIWSESDARFVSKVDDDCLVDPRWLDVLSAAHDANTAFGVVGSWRHPDEDFVPELAERKIEQYAGGHALLRNHWVQGSGFLCSRRWVEAAGPIEPQESFTAYCLRLARLGSVNGWYFPFIREEHMDDPRSPHSLITDDDSLRRRLPLSAQANGVATVAQWEAQLRQSARVVQGASLDLRRYSGWRLRRRNAVRRLKLLSGHPARW